MMQLHILKWENKTKSVGLKKYLNTPGNFAERGVFNGVFCFFFETVRTIFYKFANIT